MATSTMSPSSHASHNHPRSSHRQQRPTPALRTPSARSPPAISHTLSPSVARSTSRGSRQQSPSYFGLALDTKQVDGGDDSHESSYAHQNWSAPGSRIRSTAAASPMVVPLDQNPDFDAFRRAAEANKGNLANNFGNARPHGSLSGFSTRSARGPVDSSYPSTSIRPSMNQQAHKENPGNASGSGDEQGTQRRSPKRLLSSPTQGLTERPRRQSPASFIDRDEGLAVQSAHFAGQQRPRQSLPHSNGFRPPHPRSDISNLNRAETLPPGNEAENAPDGGPTFVTSQHVVSLLETSNEDILLLDLRVSTQYAQASISSALNLCIPTTLLKRPSFNVQKLAETFKDTAQRAKFEKWRNSRYIVVFDQATIQMKDAAICVNTLKKFASEGWTGGSYIVRGGFREFSSKFPGLVKSGGVSKVSTGKPALSLNMDRPEVAPVAGGCPMPVTKDAANPFFGNIRQNMDLIGGVGQMSVKYPATLTQQQEQQLPRWVRKATDPQDQGKLVADKFLGIEKDEQKRMQEALSGNVTYTSGSPSSKFALESPSGVRRAPDGKIQIAGIEKGSKNRYNNIWPYEHSRVSLNCEAGECDYVNANHIKERWSSKRYIATQGPIPATFSDFWNVIWQQDVRVIVMLTAEREGGQIKAHNYWKGGTFGNLKLTYMSEHRASLEPQRIHAHYRLNSNLSSGTHSTKPQPQTSHSSSSAKQLDGVPSGQRRATVTNPPPPNATIKDPGASGDQPYLVVRRFTLSRADRPFERMREITQLQYSSWPDFGAPAHPAHLLGLIEQCDAVTRQSHGGDLEKAELNKERPVLVHCSAGCGRTGTFCTVDSVVDLLKKQRAYQAKKKEREVKVDTSKRVREPTPMELDSLASPVSARASGGSLNADRMSIDVADAPDFFSSASSQASAEVDAGESSWLDREDIDLVEKVVGEFRLQRLSMVQSLRQYVLCYESVLEWLAGQMSKTV